MDQEFNMMKIEVKHVAEFKKFSDDWNHEHCEFCFAKFMEKGNENTIQEGYCSLDNQNWICPTCYEDFKERFKWTLVEHPQEA